MGVLACDRNGCSNIMCDRLILNHRYYICNDCFEELEKFKDQWQAPMSKSEIETRITDFMGTYPGRFGNSVDIDEVFYSLVEYR